MIKKLDIVDSTLYVLYKEHAHELPDAIDPYTKQALLEIQEKINEIIKITNRKNGTNK